MKDNSNQNNKITDNKRNNISELDTNMSPHVILLQIKIEMIKEELNPHKKNLEMGVSLSQ